MQSTRVKLAPHFFRLALPLGLILLAVGLFLSTHSLEAYYKSPFPLALSPRFNERITLPTEATARLDQARVPVEDQLRRGETVTAVFEKLGLHGADAREATNALAEHVELRVLKAGDHYSAFFNPDSSLASFALTVTGSGRVEMRRAAGSWTTDWQPFQRSVEVRALRGSLDGPLESSIRRAGGPLTLAYRMADVLQWDLDFSRDLQRGDHFEVLYEEILLDGQPQDVGRILAVVYDNDGRRHEAYRYGDSGVFYDGEGRPLKKMFLRSPLRYSRITSVFSQHRFHPVLKIFRPHYGVDYGAPVGTPVEVTANGVVTFAGWDRGGGNVVKIRHTGGYVTAYLHLSRFAAGVRPGTRVGQGDVIAYTGATGLASGPHLDYRVQHNGAWIDPLSLKGVRDEPIPTRELASFRAWRDDIRISMASGKVPPGLAVPGEDVRLAVSRETPRLRPGAVAR
ncbi:MAG TPA: peptidoglycan DD-metalloendopeptidase family protein [Thermoanaerobaculia bacterium]|nr:peptidoglycan DD-metalloendopeptidase family protein [Thermoanaerobaculia bacterium]